MKTKTLLVLGALVSLGACATVLGLHTPDNHPFEHRAHVLEGIACTACHEGIRNATDDGPLHLPETGVCTRCHEEPHTDETCRKCHGLDYTVARVAMARYYLRFSHRRHLRVVHSNCARCHQDVAYSDTTLLPRMPTCLSCHPHRDTFELANCGDCHHDLEIENVRPRSHLVHEEDYVRRHAQDAAARRAVCDTCHTEQQCAGCHGANVPALPQRLRFDQPQLAGLHRAGFRSRHGREARVEPGLCVTCHTEASCQRCHSEQGLAADGQASRNPHPPGWVGTTPSSNRHGIEARRDPVSCASCHSGAGEALCVSCHRVGGIGGTVHPPGWSSSLDPVRNAPCRLCHDRSQ